MGKKVIAFQIPKSQKEFIRFQQDWGKHFYDQLHQHPQWQLTLIKEGKGQFLSGDYMGRFQPGDLFMIGSDVPHVFRSDPEYFEESSTMSIHGCTVFFDFMVLQNAIEEIEDLRELRHFDVKSGNSYQVLGETRSLIVSFFDGLGSSSGLSRLKGAFEVLDLLMQHPEDLRLLNTKPLNSSFSEKDGNRMGEVMQFLLERRFQQISLAETAARSNMSKEAFCRFFKLRTGRTFTQYLQQLRVSEAQKLLLETDLGIAEIAYRVGYENLSYFNRSFKSIAGITPKHYRILG